MENKNYAVGLPVLIFAFVGLLVACAFMYYQGQQSVPSSSELHGNDPYEHAQGGSFKTKEACESNTGTSCSFVMCDMDCPKDFVKGWQPTNVKPSDKIVYTTRSDADQAPLRKDCSERKGTFNTCGSPCSSETNACVSVCALTCDLIKDPNQKYPTEVVDGKDDPYEKFPLIVYNQSSGPCPTADGCKSERIVDASGGLTVNGTFVKSIDSTTLAKIKSIITSSNVLQKGCTQTGVTDVHETWTISLDGENKKTVSADQCKELVSVKALLDK